MKAIAVIAKNRAIGRQGQLLFHLPSDLAHFKANTLGKTCIMGRKTLESMPKGQPLPGRNTIVISKSLPAGLFWEKDGFRAVAASSKGDALSALNQYHFENPVVCGGAQIYELFLEDCEELILTEVEEEVKDADAYFPQYTGKFRLSEEGAPQTENGLTYKINRYERV